MRNFVVGFGMVAAAFGTYAQTPPAVRAPDPGQLLNQLRNLEIRESNQASPGQPTPLPSEPPTVSPSNLDTSIAIKKVVVKGSRLFSEFELMQATASLEGRQLTLPQLIREVQVITKMYRDQGFIAQTTIPEQRVVDGVITVEVIEGVLGEIKLTNENGTNITESQILAALNARQIKGEPLDTRKLERAMLNLNDLSGVSASASLQPGGQPGAVDEVITVKKTRGFEGSVSFDNTGTRSVGENRVGAQLGFNNIDGRGGRLGLGFVGLVLPERVNPFVSASYTTPIGNDGATVNLAASYLEYKLGEQFADANIKGESNSLGFGLAYPFIRSSTANLIGSGKLERRNLKSTIGVECIPLTNKAVNAITLGIQYDSLDGFADRYSTASVNLSAGEVKFDAAPPQAGIPDGCGNTAVLVLNISGTAGRYSKLNASYTLQQRIVPSLSLSFSSAGQLAFSDLDTSEQFGLGGAFGVRSYPASEGFGDIGALASAELRYQLGDGWVAAGFLDAGHVRVRRNAPTDNTTTPAARNSGSLYGAGLSILKSKPGSYNLSAAVAWKIGNNPFASATGTDSDGRDRSPRLLLNAAVPF